MSTLPKPPKLTQELMLRAVQKMREKEASEWIARTNRSYLHWDKLRFRAPSGVSPDEAWALAKLSRIPHQRPLKLRDEKNRPFTFFPTEQIQRILHEVDRWGGNSLGVAQETPPMLDNVRDRLIISSLMEEAIATAQIEGAVTTRNVARELLSSGRKPRDKSERMIVNSFRTMQLLREHVAKPLDRDLLFLIQETMTKDTLDDSSAAGRFRTEADDIHVMDTRDNEIVYTPPPAKQLGSRLNKLFQFANTPEREDEFIHPVLKAAILHFWLAFEHPFADGNGRTARALFYWFMLKSGYWLFEFLTISRVIADSPAGYYRSFLYSEQDDNDLTYSLSHMLEVTHKALKQLHENLKQKQEEHRQLSSLLKNVPNLNLRQHVVLEAALADPAQWFTFQSHAAAEGITYLTARTDLFDLERKGYLRKNRSGRQIVFRAADDLIEQINGSTGERPE